MDLSLLEQHVKESALVVSFLSRGYFLSANSMREVRAAVAFSIPVIAVHEENSDRGGATLDALRAECPPDLLDAIFDSGYGAPVPWLRAKPLQLASLTTLAEALLYALESWSGGGARMAPSAETKARLQLRTMGEAISDVHVVPMPGTLVFASTNNPGALAFAELLAMATEGLTLASVSPTTHDTSSCLAPERSMPSRLSTARRARRLPSPAMEAGHAARWSTSAEQSGARSSFRRSVADRGDIERSSHFLLLLNNQAFLGHAGAKLASELRIALALAIPIILVHETRVDHGGVSDL